MVPLQAGACIHVRVGKKNWDALYPNAEGARGVSMQLGSLGERCKFPQRVRAEPAAKRHLVPF